MSALQSAYRMSGRDWGAVVIGFVGAFLTGLALTGESSGLGLILLAVGLVLIAIALGLAASSILERRSEWRERNRWDAFRKALSDGVRFEVPEGMGYAETLPAALDDLADTDLPSDGEARHAIVGEEGPIRWCAFQHDRESGTSTVGMVGLHPDRTADTYPHFEVLVADAQAPEFRDRFVVQAEDETLAGAVLHEQAREQLMNGDPFEWQLIGNQIITVADSPSTPEEAIAFIDERVKPLARVAAQIPLDA